MAVESRQRRTEEEPSERRDGLIRLLLDTLPVAVLHCDHEGWIEYFNPQAVALWGREPRRYDPQDRYCGAYRILNMRGELVPRAECPMAVTLATGVAEMDRELILERPDGTRLIILVNVVAHKDASGQVIGAVSCMLDITARKHAEALLENREREYRTMVESSPDVIIRYDRELRRLFVNSAASATLQLSQATLLSGTAGSAATDAGLEPAPEQPEQFRAAIQRVFATGELCELPITWPAPDGPRMFHVYLAPERDANGAIASVLGIGRDVTRLKSSEQALRRAQTYLADGQRLTRTGSWAWSPKTRENLFWSDETHHIFGFEPPVAGDGFLSPASFRDMMTRIHPDDLAAFRERLERSLRERTDSERDYRIIQPDGSVKFIHSLSHPLLDETGEVVEMVGTVMDVTERKLSEALLTAEKRILEMIARGAPLADMLNDICAAIDEQSPRVISTILVMDPDGTRLWPMAGPHSPPEWNLMITPLAVGPCAGCCGTAAYRRQPVVVVDIATDPLWAGYRDAAAAHGLRACWSTPIFSVTDHVLGTFALYYDRPHSPEPRDLQLIDRATHLAQIAIERDRTQESLREAQLNLARVSRVTTVGELTAAIAHEVNQPLAAVEADASACVRWLASNPPNLGEARLSAARIAHEAQRAGDIITRIRTLLKKGEPVCIPVDLDEIVQEVVAFTRAETKRQNVKVELELMEALPRTMGDRVQLQQVILNLVLNAVESLSLVTDRPRALVIRTDRPQPQEIRVAIRDTGVGLTPEQMNRLFEAFHTTKPNGLGMGLSISRTIVETHGGRLWAEANDGPGVTFQFTLPLEKEGLP